MTWTKNTLDGFRGKMDTSKFDHMAWASIKNKTESMYMYKMFYIYFLYFTYIFYIHTFFLFYFEDLCIYM